MNKAILVGRLTKDPELKYTPQGTAVATFTIAINRKFKGKDGEKEADFIPIVVWGAMGENTAKYMQKGSEIAISGRIQVRTYNAKDGYKRYVTEVIAEEITFVGSSKRNSSNKPKDEESHGNEDYKDYGIPLDDFTPMDDDDDDLPF